MRGPARAPGSGEGPRGARWRLSVSTKSGARAFSGARAGGRADGGPSSARTGGVGEGDRAGAGRGTRRRERGARACARGGEDRPRVETSSSLGPSRTFSAQCSDGVRSRENVLRVVVFVVSNARKTLARRHSSSVVVSGGTRAESGTPRRVRRAPPRASLRDGPPAPARRPAPAPRRDGDVPDAARRANARAPGANVRDLSLIHI